MEIKNNTQVPTPPIPQSENKGSAQVFTVENIDSNAPEPNTVSPVLSLAGLFYMLILLGLNAFLLLGTGITSDDDVSSFFNGYVIFFDSLLVVAIVTVLHAVLTRKTNRSKEMVIALPMVFLLAYLLGIIFRRVLF